MRRAFSVLFLVAVGAVCAGAARADDTDRVIKALAAKDAKVRAEAFGKALHLLTKAPGHKKLEQATAKHLKSAKGYLGKIDRVMVVAQVGSEGALSLLVPYLGHKDPRLRRMVLESFASCRPYRAFLTPLKKRVRAERSGSPLRSLIKALAVYAAAFDEALPALNKLASHKKPGIRALATLAAARPGNKALYPKLLSRAGRGKDMLVRSAAILGLGRMKDRGALPKLRAIRKKSAKNEELVAVLDAAIELLEDADGAEPDELYLAALDMEVKRIRQAAVASLGPDDTLKGEGGDSKSRASNRSGRSGAGCDGR